MTGVMHALGWTLLHFLWQGALLAVATALALWALEGRDSRLRYAVACAGLLLMVMAPLVTFFLIREPSPTLFVASGHGLSASPSTIVASASTLAPRGDWPGGFDKFLPWVVILWASGSLAMSLRLAGGWVWLQWVRRRPDTQPAPDADQLLLLRLCQRMGVGSNLRLLLCWSVPGPTLLGWLKPVILIPPAMLAGLSPQQFEFILAHELAHVLRHDYLVNLLQSIAEVLFFFHPAVWWVSKKIRQEREQASDDLAVRLCGDALDYAQALTALEALASRINPPRSSPRLALGAQGGDFMSRINRLVSPMAPTLLAPRAGLVVLLLLGSAFALPARTPTPLQAASEKDAALPKGRVHLRRYDVDGPDGQKAGTIDMKVEFATLAAMEGAFAQLQKIPADLAKGYVEVLAVAKMPETGSIWNYKFTGVDPARVLTIIRAQEALAPIDKKPGLLVIQRYNSFTYEGGLLPKGLFVNIWAGDIPADIVVQALNELEAMAPKAGIPQEVRWEIPQGTGKGVVVTLDLSSVDPTQVRHTLESALAKPKP
jgi:beta-lactamase regulating signal transducer with metallopeptidase domain